MLEDWWITNIQISNFTEEGHFWEVSGCAVIKKIFLILFNSKVYHRFLKPNTGLSSEPDEFILQPPVMFIYLILFSYLRLGF
jgi:hypothetical protein